MHARCHAQAGDRPKCHSKKDGAPLHAADGDQKGARYRKAHADRHTDQREEHHAARAEGGPGQQTFW